VPRAWVYAVNDVGHGEALGVRAAGEVGRRDDQRLWSIYQHLTFEPRQNVASGNHTEDLAVGLDWYVANAVLGHFAYDISHGGARFDCHEIE
jgi:hypothetical protein